MIWLCQHIDILRVSNSQQLLCVISVLIRGNPGLVHTIKTNKFTAKGIKCYFHIRAALCITANSAGPQTADIKDSFLPLYED